MKIFNEEIYNKLLQMAADCWKWLRMKKVAGWLKIMNIKCKLS